MGLLYFAKSAKSLTWPDKFTTSNKTLPSIQKEQNKKTNDEKHGEIRTNTGSAFVC